MRKIEQWIDENYKKVVITLLLLLPAFIIEWHIDEATESGQQFDDVTQKVEVLNHTEEAKGISEEDLKEIKDDLRHIHDLLHEKE